jgi:hypothetical protein
VSTIMRAPAVIRVPFDGLERPATCSFTSKSWSVGF